MTPLPDPPYVDERDILDIVTDAAVTLIDRKFKLTFDSYNEDIKELYERTDGLARTMHRLALLLAASRPTRWARFKAFLRRSIYDDRPPYEPAHTPDVPLPETEPAHWRSQREELHEIRLGDLD